MDRNKPGPSGRVGKQKLGAPHHGSELFALGSKSTSSRDDGKSKIMPTKPVPADRKRDAPSHASVPSKKPKIIPSSSSIRQSDGSNSSGSAVCEYWEQIALECDTVDLITTVLSAIEMQDSDSVVALVCGAIKSLIAPRTKPESMLLLSLLYLAKLRPHLFCNETITSALVSILKRDASFAFKGRGNSTVHILAANLLARGYHNKSQWPETFIRLYIDDAINERVWCDHEECTSFVDNICTAFGTKTPPKSMLQPEVIPGTSANITGRDSFGLDDDSGEGNSAGETIRSTELCLDCPTQPRYAHLSSIVEKLVLDAVKEQLNRRQAPDCSTRNFLRFLSTVSGLKEIRATAITRLELWIHNGKLMKQAQELLTYICYNVTGHGTRDHEVLANLVKMRLKTKPLINVYMNCLKEMITLQPDILIIVLKYVVQNELSNSRNPNNMGMLASMFQTKPDEAASHLAEIYQEFLLQREDCLRTLRVFLRELVKMLRYDMKLTTFCKTFLSTTMLGMQLETLDYHDRIFFSMIDLVCLSMFLCVSPQIREAHVSLRAGRAAREIKGSPVLFEYYDQIVQIQTDALHWILNIAPLIFKPSDSEFSAALHKLIWLDAPEQYSKGGDQWPPEPERALLLRLVSEVPICQDSLESIILIGITKEIPFKVPDTMEILEQVVRRSASLRISEYPALAADKLEMIDYLFSMAEYHHPENIGLPVGYEPPKLAISSLYWKAWNILLMLSAHNPTTFGAFCWEQYPMLKNLMEMCITNQFTDSKPPDEELQVAMLEKMQILEFEKHLAAATSKVVITEQNSLLLSQLMLMDPMGVARRPPNHILEQFQLENTSHKLGHLLCRSRKPDLLLDIIQRQGTSQSMPWLADLVQNSEGDFNHLPVQCLCEFLLSNSENISNENSRDLELLSYLQRLLIEDTGDHQASCEVLEYFLRRLSSTSKQSRALAIKALRLLMGVFHKEDEVIDADYLDSDWLLRYLPMIPHFMTVRLIVNIQLRAACQIENNPDLVMTYIQFIAANTQHDPVSEMLDHVMDMSQLIVERSTVFSYIVPTGRGDSDDEIRMQTLNCLFVMYNNYLIKLREHKSPYTWAEYPDLLTVHFTDGSQLPIHLNIIQAFVILLTYSNVIPNAQPILDYWFPINAPSPQAYTLETAEPVQILPDWLKLKMIRSNVDRLVDAALQDVTPDQITLFLQSFGTPVNSLSKMLALLDRAVIEQFDAVKRAVVSREYIAQLIEIQQTRGAKNGHIAVQALELYGQTLIEQSNVEIGVIESLTIDLQEDSTRMDSTSRTKDIEEVVDMILKKPLLLKMNRSRYRRLMQKLIAKDLPKKKLPHKFEIAYGSAENVQQYTMAKILQYLQRMVNDRHTIYVMKNLNQSAESCCLFRSLFNYRPDNMEQNTYVVKIMDYFINNLKSTVQPILIQILLSKRKNFLKQSDDKIEGDVPISIFTLLSNHTARKGDALQYDLETKGKQLLNEVLKQSDPGQLVGAITAALKFSIGFKHEPGVHTSGHGIGLLVDWLADIDSELVVSRHEQQLDLLFSQSLHQFRFYMLSLLSHQSSWNSLHMTVNRLLSEFNAMYDPSSVLHFIDALIKNPKLWQGRDKATPKHEQVEHVLQMNSGQIQVFVDYVLAEGAKDPDKIGDRTQILLKCVNPKRFDLKRLINRTKNHSANDELKRRFLQQVYLNVPPMKFVVNDLNDIFEADSTKLVGCDADKVSNYTLTTIACLTGTKEYQSLSSDMEILLRKLAASHPALLLRQLSVLASLLQGRGHMDMHLLKNGYHLTLFNQVLGVLEILQPLLFEEPYTNSLHQALECFFTLFRYHGNAKETYHLMLRFMELLQAYTNKSASRALNFIEPYGELMQDLAINNRNIAALQQIVQGVSLLKHRPTISQPNQPSEVVKIDDEPKPSTSAEPIASTSTGSPNITEVNENFGAAAVILAPYSKQTNLPNNWSHLMSTINRRSDDEIVSALQEIEALTAKRQGLLEPLFERILELLTSPVGLVRNIAHILLARHLKYNPGNVAINACALSAYVQCLRDRDPSIALSALDTLTEIVMCLQEYAQEILSTVFNMGIESDINTFEPIRKCILALKTQHAC